MRHIMPSDIGGTRLGQPIDRREPDEPYWYQLGDSIRTALRLKGMWLNDEGRRAVEDLGQELYERLGYYERKVLATESVVVERGLIDPEEIAPRPAGAPPLAVRTKPYARESWSTTPGQKPLFAIDDSVRVLDEWPPGHIRTPGYVRGKVGCVKSIHGPYPVPETLGYGGTGLPAEWLYTIEFALSTLWSDYVGQASDVANVDLYQHWLQPA